MVIHLHIPKTAGSTLYENILKHHDVYSDHYPYGIHKLINKFTRKDKKPKYFTFLRDPVERTLSQINHCIREHGRGPKFANHIGDANSHGVGLMWVLRDCEKFGWIDNVMTRQLSGLARVTALDIHNDNIWRMRIYNPFHCLTRRYLPHEYKQMVSTAIENLKKMAFVGFVERAERDCRKLCRTFKWQAPTKIENHKVGSGPLELTDEIRPILEAMNKYDSKLYEAAKEMWW